MPNSPHISEDKAQVLNEARQKTGLGENTDYAVSKSKAQKYRESKFLKEWESAPPRWSSGLVQLMDDMLLQQANEFGPDSIFRKEAGQMNADHYLLSPLVIIRLIAIPLAVVFDLSSFIGISLLLWGLGMMFNQATTTNDWLSSIRF
jgi:hypothetical protein